LTEDPNLAQQSASEPLPRPPRSPIRRLGCTLAVIVWFLILLLPCFLGVLAVQQEISINTGSLPGQQIRLWLISEAEQRGLALSTGTVHQSVDNAACVQTNVNYYLWTGSEAPSIYCDCYERSSSDMPWSYVTSTAGACSP
jgi:hypothetical protein